MEPDDLLCARNARPQKDEEGAARCPPCLQNAHDETVLVRCAQSRAALATPLKERSREEAPTILLARRTRTIGMCSFDARTRGSTRLPLRMKQGIEMTHAVEDQSALIPEERTSEFGGIICNFVRRPHGDQHRRPSKRGTASDLGRIIEKDEDRSMREESGGVIVR
jgi:hypothetical protein